MSSMNKVRFAGFAIPTTPSSIVGVGDVNGPGAVAGTYPALEDSSKDIAARLDVMEAAVKTAFAEIDKQDDEDVLNVFVAPEFYWHSDIGPYVFSPGETDPAEYILEQLQGRFTAEKYPNTLFIFGTVISAQVDNLEAVLNDSSVLERNKVVRSIGEGWVNTTGAIKDALFDMMVNFVKLGHAYPKVEVRNRALVVGSENLKSVSGDMQAKSLTAEKYFASNEDFLLWDVTGKPVITEQMVAYPVLDLSGGDLKQSPGDSKAIFKLDDGPNIGVEICLDHSDHRLRRSAARSPWPSDGQGVNLHLVPSCGMQLHPASIAAISGGLAFNCDGLYGLDDSASGEIVKGNVGGVESIHVSYIDGDDTTYGAHSQLARVVQGPVGGDSAKPGTKDAVTEIPEVDVTVVSVDGTPDLHTVFAGGPGAIHIYGLKEPVSI
ncbi:hypothetical protein U6G28_10385 [Actinomycetaceae bacterium MB13-C1-2]|nr:hypothetical protein U6G28_10385 [Actinomycetaceae bacterium MB13-C1-2]